jgi:hypothetical protein
MRDDAGECAMMVPGTREVELGWSARVDDVRSRSRENVVV